MSEQQIVRKAHTGEPGNKGEFGSKGTGEATDVVLGAEPVYEAAVASKAMRGDTITVFAHEVDRFNEGRGGELSGTVSATRPTRLLGTTNRGVRIDFTDGRSVEAVEYAVTTWQGYHDPRPSDDDDEDAVCRDCGRRVTWVGPHTELDWMHVDDPRNA